uniref:RxLR effector candidate protein n=1 Tax=Hyaloperonospora arabidopsidis (strain Emoy2) TaxID=559515 RepID=M4BGU6_HYAAE
MAVAFLAALGVRAVCAYWCPVLRKCCGFRSVAWHYRPIMNLRGERFEFEHICWYPKDGELCLSRVKPGETLVEARSDSDVQIDRRTWV